MFAPALRPSDAASDAPTLAADDGALPERWLLARALDAKSVRPVIVMYPKASQLYSLRARRVMGEAAQLEWLEALVAARGEAYARACALGAGGADLGPRLISVLAGTKEWAVLHVRHCFRLYKSRLHEKCWGCLAEFFAGLRACTAPRGGDAEGAAADGWAGMSEQTRVERVVLQRSCQTMLALAARVWTPQRHAAWQQLLFAARTAGMGRSGSLIELLEIQTKAHHSHDGAEESPPSSPPHPSPRAPPQLAPCPRRGRVQVRSLDVSG